MNFALVQNIVRRRPRALRGGKAPLYWKRELSNLTEGLGSMPRRCDWVGEIAETHPRLLSEPLLGTCLTAVTSTRVARSDSNDDAPENRLTSPSLTSNRGKEFESEPAALSQRKQIRSPAATNQKSEGARHFEMASQLPRRVPDSLLRHAAPDALHFAENLIGSTSSLPHGGASSPPVNSSQKMTRLEWLQVVADRAARRWTNDWIFPSTRKYSSPAVTVAWYNKSRAPEASPQSRASDTTASAPPATVETNFLPLLNDDWLLPIGGQQASPQLLTSLVKHPRTERGTPEQIHRSTETFNGINSEPRGLPSSPDPLTTGRRSFAEGPEFSRPLEKMFDRQSPDLAANSDRTLQSSPPESTINCEEREQRASPDLAPIALTPALSPLLPPSSAGSPVMPVAADTARRIAWRDEVEAHETDLGVLAAQMKRILDEEARRHGIDV